jgi:cytoskeletal protein RodZ
VFPERSRLQQFAGCCILCRMSRITFFFICAALVLALAVWVTHSRRVAAEAAAHAAKAQASSSVQASASPAVQAPTNDVEPEPASVPQATEGSDMPASSETAAMAITGTLFQCVDNAGKTSIRKSPCPDDMKTVKVIPYSVPANSQTVVEIDQQQTVTNTVQYIQPQQQTRTETAAAHCSDAKKYAESERQRLGLNATFTQLSSLDDIVYEACKSQ